MLLVGSHTRGTDNQLRSLREFISPIECKRPYRLFVLQHAVPIDRRATTPSQMASAITICVQHRQHSRTRSSSPLGPIHQASNGAFLSTMSSRHPIETHTRKGHRGARPDRIPPRSPLLLQTLLTYGSDTRQFLLACPSGVPSHSLEQTNV
jgi:hypothetical protein